MGRIRGGTCGGGVDRHVVSGVVEELGAGVPLDVMGIVVTPAQLHIYPVLVAGLLVHQIVRVRHQAARTTAQHVSTSNMTAEQQCNDSASPTDDRVASRKDGGGCAPGLGHGPSVGGKEQDVCAGRVHFVGLARMDGLLLHSLNLQRVQLLVKYLAPVRRQQELTHAPFVMR